MAEGPLTTGHNAALSFTRFLVGPGDDTPLSYSHPGTRYQATLIESPQPRSLVAQTLTVENGHRVELPKEAGSGLVIWLRVDATPH